MPEEKKKMRFLEKKAICHIKPTNVKRPPAYNLSGNSSKKSKKK